MYVIYFLGQSSAVKYIILYPETGPRETDQSFEKKVYEEVSFLLRTYKYFA